MFFDSSGLFFKESLRSIKFENNKKVICLEIQKLDKNTVFNSNFEELIKYYVELYSFDQITLKKDEIYQLEVEEITIQRRNHDIFNDIRNKAPRFTIVIPFEGNGDLLLYQPSLIIGVKINGTVINNEIHLYFINRESGSFEGEVNRIIKCVDDYINAMNQDIKGFNNSLEDFVRSELNQRKSKLRAIERQAQNLGYPIKRRREPPTSFQVPLKRKEIKLVPPKISTEIKPPAPSISIDIYESILEVCSSMSLVMERNPRSFRDLEEETIRDFFLLVLNAFFEGEATGETFNKKGKTDILIRHENANIFIAECKVWAGPKVLHDAITQLLGYCTWRDTKTAIFFFNKNVKISTILKKLEEEVKKNQYYIRGNPVINKNLQRKGVYSYIFALPEDEEIKVNLSILVFDIPKIE